MNNNNSAEARLKQKLHAEMGDVLRSALQDLTVQEIMLNPDGNLWVEHFGQPMQIVGRMSAVDAMAFMASIASSLNTTITPERPSLSGALFLLGGHRFMGWIPPAVNGGPGFAIRKKATQVFSLDHYVRQEVMSKAQQQTLQEAIKNRLNILVVGGTGSGKTTLTNALIDEISTKHSEVRLIIIEDTAEIQCNATNHIILAASADISMQKLLYETLRGRPDRILVGEVRGAEALTLLKAWNTGHPGGIATLHANNARAALTRLEHLVAESGRTKGISALIGEAIDLVVVINKSSSTPAGRKITEIMRVINYKDGEYQTEYL